MFGEYAILNLILDEMVKEVCSPEIISRPLGFYAF